MNDAVKDRIAQSLLDTRLGSISPDYEEIETILSLKGSRLSFLTSKDLTHYIYSLSQYLIFLQVQVNIRNIKYIDAKKAYETALAREMSTKDTKRTLKEKTSEVLLSSEKLQQLSQALQVKEADYRLFDKIPDHILELVNALKKELATRG